MAAQQEQVRCAVPSQDVLGETPLWCAQTQSLLWLDIDAARLQRFQPASGRRDSFAFAGHQYLGSLALTALPGRVLIGLDLGLFLFDMGSGDLRKLCQVEPAENDNRLNDGRCDASGRFWVGTMDNQLHRPHGAFYCVEPDGAVHRQFGDVIVSNTVAFSPQYDRLYFSDTRRFTTWQFGLDLASGRLGPREVFVDHSAAKVRPDGACVDAEGYIWNALFADGRVVRYTPSGEVDRVIELPVRNPTCVCLGGPDLKTLFITTARKFLDEQTLAQQPWSGSVLAVDVDVPGLPEPRFGAV